MSIHETLVHGHDCANHQCKIHHGQAPASVRRPWSKAGQAPQYAPDLGILARHVKLTLSIDPERRVLVGTASTTVEASFSAVNEVFFEAADSVKFEKVYVAGSDAALTYRTVDGGIIAVLPARLEKGAKIEIAIDYHLEKPKAGIYFTGPAVMYPNKPFQTWTQGEDQDSHHWFPVAGADYPNHKMTCEAIITVPAAYTALSNGKLLSETADDKNGTRTFHWHQTRPHTSYLFTLAIGAFIKLEKHWRGMPVQLYCDPSLEEQAREYFEGTENLIELFSKLTGVDYPWEGKYAQVMVQNFMFGGMENTTMTTMTDSILANHETRAEYRKSEIRLNAHELFHHWFGDLITCKAWAHAFLNEGTTTYSEVLTMEALYGIMERDYYVKTVRDTYMREDARYRRPLVTNLYVDPMDMFDAHTYQKGGLTHHMLRYILGDDGYFATLRTFLLDNAYQTVDTNDLLKAIAKVTGRNLTQFFDQWMYGAGFPEYKVSYAFDEAKKTASVRVQQTQKLEDATGIFTMPIVFSFGFADGSSQEFKPTVANADETFTFALKQPPTIFRFDPSNWVLKTVDLKGVPKKMLLSQLAHDTTVMSRVDAAQALESIGGTGVVEALEAACKSSIHWGVSVEAANCLGRLKNVKAMRALKRLITHDDPAVRRAVVRNLGEYKHDSVVSLLAGIASSANEKSQFVRAESLQSLGKTKSAKAFDVLKAALEVSSWNDIIRVGALSGLAASEDDRAVEVLVAYAGPGYSIQARPAAIKGLGVLAKAKPKLALRQLHGVIETFELDQYTLNLAAVTALGESKSRKSLPLLKHLEQNAKDARIRRSASQEIEEIVDPMEEHVSDVARVSSELARLNKDVRNIKRGMRSSSRKKVF
ncbi:MAG: M1 family metallopeptidase [Candidatus Obscuribacterales bacterium]|nr:M1 family metallopeptidase [Candidatus Obscuribacterales bacterium]